MGIFNFLTQELAIDLGTANTLIVYKDKVVVDEPSIIAKNRTTGEIIAIGKEAQKMHGKAHENIKTIRPLKDGVIADFEAAEQMIRGMIKLINPSKSLFKPQLKMVICIPSGITEVEKRAVKESAERAGAKEVYLIHEPMAAAIGIGIDVAEPMGNMIIDIGGGTTEIAVIALSGIVLLNLPLALIGGVFSIYFTSSVISIPAIIGFITLFGIATRNGILLITHYQRIRCENPSLYDTIICGSVDRLNPILMTALTAALALIPLAMSGDVSGNEIQSPMAKVILGGLLTSTLLNIYVVPAVYMIYEKLKAKREIEK